MKDIHRGRSSAAVAVLMFNRPEVTRATLQHIVQARPSAVYLIADGPRTGHPSDIRACAAVRDIATSMPWDCPVHTLFAEENMGLRARVSSGLDWVFSLEPAAIVLEDDCLADSSFFPYASELLERYRESARVGIISGNNFLRGLRVSPESYFFSPDARIWGWATWDRVWRDFSKEGLNHRWEESEALTAVARLESASRRRALVADSRRAHKIDSWALPFVLHFQKRGYLSAVPSVNLVTNVGFGTGSTHTKFESFTAEVKSGTLTFPLIHPQSVSAVPGVGMQEDRIARRRWWIFPLRHPWDFLGRILRYVRLRVTGAD